jgi:hypothetical protein
MRELLRLVYDSLVSCKPLLVQPEHFTNEINYHHFLYAMEIACSAPTLDVYLAPSYVLFSVYMHEYAVGVASDGKLFVNKIAYRPVGKQVNTIIYNDRKIYVHELTDTDVWHLLRYDYDVEAEEILIDRTGVYRVQGDLLIEVEEYRPGNRILGRLANAQAWLLLDTIARILVELRITTSMVNADQVSLTVPFSFPISIQRFKEKEVTDVGKTILEKLSRVLYERVAMLGTASTMSKLETGIEIYGAGDYRNCQIRLKDSGLFLAGDLAQYYATFDVVISTHCDSKNIAGTLLEKMYEDFQKAYKPDTFNLNVGNHHIRLQKARSLTIRYRPKWQPLLLGDLVVEIDGQGWYHVTPDTVISIMHDEHGVTTIRFNDEYKIRFRTIYLARGHDYERNAIVLSLLP